MPSPTRFMQPGMWWMSMIWWAITLVCVVFRSMLTKMSHNAWQSVLISTENPQMISLNLLSVNFGVANSNINGFYFSSAGDVCFKVKAMGWSLVATLPLGRVSMDFWVSTAPKPSLQPSNVTMNSVPLKQGALKMGWVIKTCLRPRNAFSGAVDQQLASLIFWRATWYAAFLECLGIAAALRRSESGWARQV